MIGSAKDDRQCRGGVVLGLTMAEALLLRIVRLMLILAIRLKDQSKEIAKLDRLAELDSAIVESKTFVRESASSQLENGVITAQDYVIYQNAQDQAKLNLELHRIQAVMARIDHQLTQGN